MRGLLGLAWRSLWNRRLSVGLTVLTLTVSVTLLLGVEQLRREARASFVQTISGTDLIVGARTSPVQLMLYSVFHIGSPTNEMGWDAYRWVAEHPLVDWTVPIALGDSHRGFRVMGTRQAIFQRYRYARDRTLQFQAGGPFGDLFDAVIGSQVARQLGYQLDQPMVISHGIARRSFLDHGDKPFTLVGILQPTGTPLDRSVLVSLEAIEAIHADWQQGRPPAPGERISAEQVRAMDLQPRTVTAALVGLKSRIATFRVQRAINNYAGEPLTAALPGVALSELWTVVGVVETALLAVSAFVVAAGLIGMAATLITSLSERRREMAILRAVGARPHHIFSLFILEGALIGITAALLGLGLVQLLLRLGREAILQLAGIALSPASLAPTDALILVSVVAASLLASALPGWLAYRQSLADGLSVRL